MSVVDFVQIIYLKELREVMRSSSSWVAVEAPPKLLSDLLLLLTADTDDS